MKSSIKIVLVGDSGVGKSQITRCYTHQQFCSAHLPTMFDSFIKSEENQYHITIWDTSSSSNFTTNCYSDADLIIFCFDVSNRSSLNHLENKWRAKVQKFCPQAQLFLLGTKCDMRDSDRTCIPVETATAFAQKIGAVSYLECSAKANYNVIEAIGAAIFQVTFPLASNSQLNINTSSEKIVTRKRERLREKVVQLAGKLPSRAKNITFSQ